MDSLAEAKKAGRLAITVKSIGDVAGKPGFEATFRRFADTKKSRQTMTLYDPADKGTEKIRRETYPKALQLFRDRHQVIASLTSYH